MSEDPKRWSQPFAALLGAFDAQIGFGLPSIGGKDSMSGTFNDIDVPPTLVSFAVDVAREKDVITPELKEAGDKLVLFTIEKSTSLSPASFSSGVITSFSLATSTAKETSVGGTSISLKVPDMESFPPMDGSPKPICASNAPSSAANG